jgi:hypothetical protein
MSALGQKRTHARQHYRSRKKGRLAAVLHPLLFVFTIMLLLSFASRASRTDVKHSGRWRRMGGWENDQFETPTHYRNLRGSSPATSPPQKFNVEFREPDSRNCFGQKRSKKMGMLLIFYRRHRAYQTPTSFVETGRNPSYG